MIQFNQNKNKIHTIVSRKVGPEHQKIGAAAGAASLLIKSYLKDRSEYQEQHNKITKIHNTTGPSHLPWNTGGSRRRTRRRRSSKTRKSRKNRRFSSKKRRINKRRNSRKNTFF